MDFSNQTSAVDNLVERPRIAVFFDIENVPAWCAVGVLTNLSGLGDVVSAQAFGDFRRTDSEAWAAACDSLRLGTRQVDRIISGKNSSDIHIVINVVDTLHAGDVNAVALVSGDSDFVPLAERVRDAGLSCYGFGGDEAPERLRRAFTQFYPIELLASCRESSTKASSRPTLLRPSLASRLLKRIVISLEDQTGWARIKDVEIELAVRHGGLDTRACGYKSLSALLSDLRIFEVDLGAKSGARVRRKPSRRAIRRKARREEEGMSSNQREGIKQREPMV
ncbi:NYN domain-containing protein [Mesorhizobium sp. LHD-90]|uniref:NYN domain-containing protein n=1 Tax=Mesorhizobium sp. LHD-90 TaxID=3071414 RepID=UPI0027E010EF|nr:NYN domain-containing protein [Mesorhizobium sp. LHD-90]MDQ6436653.1 NYN domain-containing protein [Mesorhizobium sp. LHD-90]